MQNQKIEESQIELRVADEPVAAPAVLPAVVVPAAPDLHAMLHSMRPAQCTTPWKYLVGDDDRVRKCKMCNANVYRFQGLDENTLAELFAEHEPQALETKRPLFQRPDGTVMFRPGECGNRVRTALVGGAMLTFIGLGALWFGAPHSVYPSLLFLGILSLASGIGNHIGRLERKLSPEPIAPFREPEQATFVRLQIAKIELNKDEGRRMLREIIADPATKKNPQMLYAAQLALANTYTASAYVSSNKLSDEVTAPAIAETLKAIELLKTTDVEKGGVRVSPSQYAAIFPRYFFQESLTRNYQLVSRISEWQKNYARADIYFEKAWQDLGESESPGTVWEEGRRHIKYLLSHNRTADAADVTKRVIAKMQTLRTDQNAAEVNSLVTTAKNFVPEVQ